MLEAEQVRPGRDRARSRTGRASPSPTDRTSAMVPGAGTSASCTTAPVSGRIAIESNTTPVTRAAAGARPTARACEARSRAAGEREPRSATTLARRCQRSRAASPHRGEEVDQWRSRRAGFHRARADRGSVPAPAARAQPCDAVRRAIAAGASPDSPGPDAANHGADHERARFRRHRRECDDARARGHAKARRSRRPNRTLRLRLGAKSASSRTSTRLASTATAVAPTSARGRQRVRPPAEVEARLHAAHEVATRFPGQPVADAPPNAQQLLPLHPGIDQGEDFVRAYPERHADAAAMVEPNHEPTTPVSSGSTTRVRSSASAWRR